MNPGRGLLLILLFFLVLFLVLVLNLFFGFLVLFLGGLRFGFLLVLGLAIIENHPAVAIVWTAVKKLAIKWVGGEGFNMFPGDGDGADYCAFDYERFVIEGDDLSRNSIAAHQRDE